MSNRLSHTPQQQQKWKKSIYVRRPIFTVDVCLLIHSRVKYVIYPVYFTGNMADSTVVHRKPRIKSYPGEGSKNLLNKKSVAPGVPISLVVSYRYQYQYRYALWDS